MVETRDLIDQPARDFRWRRFGPSLCIVESDRIKRYWGHCTAAESIPFHTLDQGIQQGKSLRRAVFWPVFGYFGASSLVINGERPFCGWQSLTIALYIHHITALGRRVLQIFSFFPKCSIQDSHVKSLSQILDLLCLTKETVPNRAPVI